MCFGFNSSSLKPVQYPLTSPYIENEVPPDSIPKDTYLKFTIGLTEYRPQGPETVRKDRNISAYNASNLIIEPLVQHLRRAVQNEF